MTSSFTGVLRKCKEKQNNIWNGVYMNIIHGIWHLILYRIKLLSESDESPGGCAIQLIGDKCEALLSLKVRKNNSIISDHQFS